MGVDLTWLLWKALVFEKDSLDQGYCILYDSYVDVQNLILNQVKILKEETLWHNFLTMNGKYKSFWSYWALFMVKGTQASHPHVEGAI